MNFKSHNLKILKLHLKLIACPNQKVEIKVKISPFLLKWSTFDMAVIALLINPCYFNIRFLNPLKMSEN